MTTKLLRPVVAALCAVTFQLQAAIPPTENLLPSDTLAFFAVPDCAAARTAAKSSPGWMFWADPAMRPFRDKLVSKFNEQFVAPLERDLGAKISDFTDLPQGQFAVALTVNGSTGHDNIPPGLLLLLDARNKSDSLKTNLALLVKKWSEAGRALRTEQIHGLSFTVVPLSSNDFAGIFPKKTPEAELGKEPPKAQPPGEIYFAQFQSLLVAGNSLKVVEPVAAHLTGGSEPAIADNAVFNADKISQFRDNPQYYGWFNGKGFFDLVAQASSAGEEDDAPSPLPGISTAKALSALGVGTLRSVSFSLRDGRDGSMLAFHVAAPESERTGLLKILALAPKDASVPPFVPADAVKFTRVRLDGKQTWAEVQKMIAGISPSGQSSLNAVINIANSLGQQKNPGFDIRTDLFGNLNDDIITYEKPVAGNSLGELANPGWLYLIAVSSPDAAINAIRTLIAMSSAQDSESKPREFLGRKIYGIALKPGAAAGGALQPRTLYASSAGGYVALSSDTAILEEFLRNADGKNQPLRENTGLLAAVQHLGGAGGGLFSYENQREAMRVTFKAVKNPAAAEATLKMFPPSFRGWIDFSLLPDYEVVSKYFYISTVAGSANSEGLTMKVFAPRPPQLN